jgi:predicted lipoprotein with Yx(FWY)xxD motif
MRSMNVLGGVALAVLAAATAGYYYRSALLSTGDSEIAAAPMAMPMGITLQSLNFGNVPLGDLRLLYGILGPTGYADSRGMALYTYDKDTVPNISACVGECIKAWPAAVAPANAQPFGSWTIAVRDDGSKQWAYNGKPLYTFAKDTAPGDANGNGAADGVWHDVLYEPAEGVQMPDGIMVTDVADANGQVFVTNDSMTLYVFNGKAGHDKPPCSDSGPCASHWIPVEAPALGNPVGHFTVAKRKDGINQWAYKGRALYTFDGDIEPGDANGVGVDRHWQPATLMRYFTPAGVTMRHTVGAGEIWATAEGKTLYRRSIYIFQQSGHGLRRGTPYNPGMGKTIGTSCDAECLKVWTPFKAASDAQSSGNWQVLTRDDGTSQWSYKGYALYTYAGDKKPGDLNGADNYRTIFEPRIGLQAVSSVAPNGPAGTEAQSPLRATYWSPAYP